VYGCQVVGVSAHLSDRARLREEMAAAAGTFDLLLTELKAAAIDVVAEVGADAGVPTVLCDNVPVSVDGTDFAEAVEAVASAAIERGWARGGRRR
jgi:cyclic 2,3-diphosphoglycerate synthetase